jgi:hypothetical protein
VTPALFAERGPWLFGRTTDLWTFGGSAALALALVLAGIPLGWVSDQSAPEWTWLALIVAIDVAHVWSTSFRVYLDGDELKRRPWLYFGAPIACYAAGLALYAHGPETFWRVLAYVAVFHFVRQQAGWVALYRRRANETDAVDRVIDTAAIYAATIYPLVYWHAHLPRSFVWFVDGDFVAGLSAPIAAALAPVYWAIGIAFVARQAWLALARRPLNHGKVLVVATTWLTWWLGIVALDSDYAFTVTNVVVHGVPYFVLTYRYGRARAASIDRPVLGFLLRRGALGFLGFVLVCAAIEETLWDRWVFHDREWLFGAGPALSETIVWLVVPLLALPQSVHYVLDAWVWRRKRNPMLSSHAAPLAAETTVARR